jgi:hypothetical protein
MLSSASLQSWTPPSLNTNFLLETYPDVGGFENTTLAGMAAPAEVNCPARSPNLTVVSEVKMAFRQILEDLKSWKPS